MQPVKDDQKKIAEALGHIYAIKLQLTMDGDAPTSQPMEGTTPQPTEGTSPQSSEGTSLQPTEGTALQPAADHVARLDQEKQNVCAERLLAALSAGGAVTLRADILDSMTSDAYKSLHNGPTQGLVTRFLNSLIVYLAATPPPAQSNPPSPGPPWWQEHLPELPYPRDWFPAIDPAKFDGMLVQKMAVLSHCGLLFHKGSLQVESTAFTLALGHVGILGHGALAKVGQILFRYADSSSVPDIVLAFVACAPTQPGTLYDPTVWAMVARQKKSHTEGKFACDVYLVDARVYTGKPEAFDGHVLFGVDEMLALGLMNFHALSCTDLERMTKKTKKHQGAQSHMQTPHARANPLCVRPVARALLSPMTC